MVKERLWLTSMTEDVGVRDNGALTVTMTFAVLPKESVTLTVELPAEFGAVKSPVEELTDPPPA